MSRCAFWAALPVLLSAKAASSQVESSPDIFYRSLANAVWSAAGDLELSLSAGHWQQNVGGRRVRWRNDANTVAHLTFDYRNGALAGAKLRVRPAAHLWAGTGGTSFSVAFDSARYDNYGRVVEWWVRPDNFNADVAASYPTIQQALELKTSPGETFIARPFARFENPQRCDAGWGGCVMNRPMVTEVRFRNHGAGSGLAVEFKPNSTIYFSRSGGGRFDNFVTLRAGSGVTFDHVRYDMATREVQGHLLNLTLDAHGGELSSTDLRLIMRSGAGIRFNDVRFARDPSGSYINADLGTLEFDAGTGSRIGLTRGHQNNSHLNLENGSRLTLHGFQLGVDDRRSTRVRIGAGSNIALQIRGGQLGIGQRGFLALGTGSLNGSLDGSWDSVDPSPDTQLGVRLLDVSVTGGVLPINGETTLTLTGGRAHSTDLRLVGRNFAGVVGTFDDLNVSVEDRSTFGVPGSFRVVTRPGAQIVAATPSKPLRFDEGSGHPSGTLALTLPYRRFEPARGQSVVLRDGTLRFAVTQEQNGAIAGTDGSLDGTLEATAGGTALTMRMELDDMALTRPAGGDAQLEARVRAVVQPGFVIDAVTPWGGVVEDVSLYPVHLTTRIASATPTTEGRLKVVRGDVTLDSLVLTPTITLTIPAGSGEHPEFDNPNSANGTHGPDEFRGWQELMVVDKQCNLHIYLKPTTYSVRSRLGLYIRTGELDVKLSGFQPDRGIEFGRDGCDPSLALTIIGAVAGGAVLGPIGVAGGGLLGRHIGNDLNDQIDATIATKMDEKINGFNKRWTIHAP
jgi:hypothetical protein